MATPKNQLPPPTSVQQTKVTSKVFVGGLPQILDSDKTQYEDKVDELQKELQKQMEEFVPGEPNLVVSHSLALCTMCMHWLSCAGDRG